MSSLGESFRDAREARGFALSDVAEQIHIRSIYLSSIENEDWAALGAPVYARGFIRTYARFLGLDPEAAVAHFNEWAAAERPVVAPNVGHSGTSGERGGPSVWVIAISLVAVLLVAFAGYEYWQYQTAGPVVSEASPAATPKGAAPAVAPAASAVAVEASSEPSAEASVPPATSNSLDIKLTERCWLRVVVDGKPVMEGLFPAGTMRSLTGKTATIRAGNAGGVSVTLNGKNLGALGGSGDVVERSFNLRGE